MSIYRNRRAGLPRGTARALALSAVLLLPHVATAQIGVAPPPPPMQVGAAPFNEPGRFQLRNVRIGGQPVGPTTAVALPSGGRVSVTVELNHACASCGASVNQIVVGLGGEGRAQACIYSGPASTFGWRTATFDINVPSRPGRYDLRARYAQAWNCGAALDWWRIDRPQGPDAASTIGVILVGPPPATPPPPPPPSPSPPSTRAPREIREEIDGRLAWIDEVGTRLAQARGPAALAALGPEELGLQLRAQVEVLRQLQRELLAARGGREHDDSWGGHRPEPARATGMEQGAYQALLSRLRDESFERYRLERLRDTLRSGARLTTAQALGVLDEFDFAAEKTKAAVVLCTAIDEPAALPYESNRRELRKQTGGRCGL